MPRDERLANTLEKRLISHDPLIGEFEEDGAESGDEQTKAEDVKPKRRARKAKEE